MEGGPEAVDLDPIGFPHYAREYSTLSWPNPDWAQPVCQ